MLKITECSPKKIISVALCMVHNDICGSEYNYVKISNVKSALCFPGESK